jgi:hypothetical protein
MTTEAAPENAARAAPDPDELRGTLFRTLSDLRAGRITADEAKVITTAITRTLFGLPKPFVASTS